MFDHVDVDPPPAGWDFVYGGPAGSDPPPLVALGVWYATQGACTGQWALAVTYFPPVGSQHFMSVYRSFRTEKAEDCPLFAAEGKTGLAVCDDQWVSPPLPDPGEQNDGERS
jgi:hypothetical protein